VKRKNGQMCWSCSEVNAGVGDFPDIHWDKDWRKEHNFTVILEHGYVLRARIIVMNLIV
jgi:hypothetical protein